MSVRSESQRSRESGRQSRDQSPSRSSQHSQNSQNSQAPKSPRRHNKIYRTPPTPPPGELLEKEKTFVLDCNAVSSISNDYSKANPKLGPVVPPYNSQRDRHTTNYFQFHGVDRTLKRSGQYDTEEKKMATSIEGPVMDRFHETGAGARYVALRNQFGAGHSREYIDGHAQFMQGIKPTTGYHGPYGFRRNTPWLRASPSPFGTSTLSSTH